MIVEALLFMLGSVIDGIILLIPDFAIDAIGGFTGVISALTQVAWIMPLSTLGICISVWLSFQLFDFGYQVAMWMVRKIPGIS